MATPIKNGKNNTWSIRFSYVDVNGKYKNIRKSGFQTKREASEWEFRERQKLERTTSTPITIQDLAEELLFVKKNITKVSPSTLESYRQYLTYLLTELPNKKIKDLTAQDIQEVVNNNLNKARKCKFYKQLLSMLYNYALRKQYTTCSPLFNVDFPAYSPQQRHYFTFEQAQTYIPIIKEKNIKIYPTIILMAYLGLRPSEALACKWENIEDNFILIKEATTTHRTSEKTRETLTHQTKTKTSVRKLPISVEMINELKSYQNSLNIKSEYICCDESGNQLSFGIVERGIRNLVNHNAIPPISAYGFRHTYGNLQKRLGTDMYTTSRLMGHSNINTTKGYYKDDLFLSKEAANKITDSFLRKK